MELKISGSATEEFICIEENRQTKSLELVKDSSDKSFNEELKYRISNCQKNGTSLDGQLLEMLDYLNDKELKTNIGSRNGSILAHGLNPISKKKANKLYSQVLSYSKRAFPDLEKYMSMSEFPKFE